MGNRRLGPLDWINCYCLTLLYGFSTLFAPVTFKLTRWLIHRPISLNFTRIRCRYTRCANTDFLHQGFPKSLSDIHTDRQTDTVHSLRRGTDISVPTELFPLVVLAVVYHLRGHFKNLRLLDWLIDSLIKICSHEKSYQTRQFSVVLFATFVEYTVIKAKFHWNQFLLTSSWRR